MIVRRSTTATLTQVAFPVLAHAKTPLLLALLKQKTDGAILVFTQTRRGADRLAHILTANKHEVATLHSDRSQSQRNRALQSFGWYAVVGEITSILTALIMLPALSLWRRDPVSRRHGDAELSS